MRPTGHPASESQSPVEPRRAADPLRAAFESGRSLAVAELVPWRGDLADPAGARIRGLARDLGSDERFDAISITDSPGGHAKLSPDVLAADLTAQGQEAIVHVTCRDRNRNELVSHGWRLASHRIQNLLILSGDLPTEGFGGHARPVFDLDSVGLLALYDRMNEGAVEHDLTRRSDEVSGARSASLPTQFFLGAAVDPFKRLERDLVPQYLKLGMKARAGARYAITQVGFDPRRLDELMRYVRDGALPLRLLANVFVLSRSTVRAFSARRVPGVILSDALIELTERAARSPDRGKEFFLDFAARQVAVARGIGYAGVYLGGLSRAEDFAAVIDRAAAYAGDDWRGLVSEVSFGLPGSFYLYRPDGAGLSDARRAPLGRPPRPPFQYRVDRALHGAVFRPGTTGFRFGAATYRAIESARMGRLAHVAERAVKGPLFGCRDCGDCSLPEIAYLCPESQCAKNQRNGPCGGAVDGECEVPGRTCIWARAYERLRPFGEAEVMLDRAPVITDQGLRRTSAWANTFLGRDHVARPARPAVSSTAVER